MAAAAPNNIEIPYAPRPEQAEIHSLMDAHRFGVVGAHRRFGKSVLTANELIKRAVSVPAKDWRGAFMAPTYSQAKGIVWDEIRRYTAPIPSHMVNFHESELRVDFINGARIRLYGAENADRMRGMYFDTVVCDEFDDYKMEVWSSIIRPAIADRKGSAYFIGTFKGANGPLGQLYDLAEDDPEWFRRIYPVTETHSLDPVEVAAAKRTMSPEEFAREFMCVRVAAVKNAILGRCVDEADEGGRITSVPHDPSIPVVTAWDLGVGDSTAI